MAGMEPSVSATVLDRLIDHLHARDVTLDGRSGQPGARSDTEK
jgi:hypothetical protein